MGAACSSFAFPYEVALHPPSDVFDVPSSSSGGEPISSSSSSSSASIIRQNEDPTATETAMGVRDKRVREEESNKRQTMSTTIMAHEHENRHHHDDTNGLTKVWPIYSSTTIAPEQPTNRRTRIPLNRRTSRSLLSRQNPAQTHRQSLKLAAQAASSAWDDAPTYHNTSGGGSPPDTAAYPRSAPASHRRIRSLDTPVNLRSTPSSPGGPRNSITINRPALALSPLQKVRPSPASPPITPARTHRNSPRSITSPYATSTLPGQIDEPMTPPGAGSSFDDETPRPTLVRLHIDVPRTCSTDQLRVLTPDTGTNPAGSPTAHRPLCTYSSASVTMTEPFDTNAAASPIERTLSSPTSSPSALHDLTSTIFHHLLNPDEFRHFTSLLTLVTFRVGDTIFDLGDPSDKLYIIQTGQVGLYVKRPYGIIPTSTTTIGTTTPHAAKNANDNMNTPTTTPTRRTNSHSNLSPHHALTPPTLPAVISYKVLNGKRVKVVSRISASEYNAALGLQRQEDGDMPYSSIGADDLTGGVGVGATPLDVEHELGISPSHVPSPIPSPSSRSFFSFPTFTSSPQPTPPNSNLPPASPPDPPAGMIQLAAHSVGQIIGMEMLSECAAAAAAPITTTPTNSNETRGGQRRLYTAKVLPPASSSSNSPSSATGVVAFTAYTLSLASLRSFFSSHPSLGPVFQIGLGCLGLHRSLAHKSPYLFQGLRREDLQLLWSIGDLRTCQSGQVIQVEAARDQRQPCLRYISKGAVLLSQRGLTSTGVVDKHYSGHKYKFVELSTSELESMEEEEQRQLQKHDDPYTFAMSESSLLDEMKSSLVTLGSTTPDSSQPDTPHSNSSSSSSTPVAASPTPSPTPPHHTPAAPSKRTILTHDSIFGLEEALLGLPNPHTAIAIMPTIMWEIPRRTLIQWTATQTRDANGAHTRHPNSRSDFPYPPISPSSSSRTLLGGVGSPISVPPSLNIIHSNLLSKWSSLRLSPLSLVMHSPPFQRCFAEYLANERSEENLKFIIYAERFRNMNIHREIWWNTANGGGGGGGNNANCQLPAMTPFVPSAISTCGAPSTTANSAPRHERKHTPSAVSTNAPSPSSALHHSFFRSSSGPFDSPTPVSGAVNGVGEADLSGSLQHLLDLAHKLYDQFLHPTRSPFQLQIHPVTRARLVYKLSRASNSSVCQIGRWVTSNLFRDAEHEIADLVVYDSLTRFRNAQQGQLWAHAIRAIIKENDKGFWPEPITGRSGLSVLGASSGVGGIGAPDLPPFVRVHSHRHPFASLLGHGSTPSKPKRRSLNRSSAPRTSNNRRVEQKWSHTNSNAASSGPATARQTPVDERDEATHVVDIRNEATTTPRSTSPSTNLPRLPRIVSSARTNGSNGTPTASQPSDSKERRVTIHGPSSLHSRRVATDVAHRRHTDGIRYIDGRLLGAPSTSPSPSPSPTPYTSTPRSASPSTPVTLPPLSAAPVMFASSGSLASHEDGIDPACASAAGSIRADMIAAASCQQAMFASSYQIEH